MMKSITILYILLELLSMIHFKERQCFIPKNQKKAERLFERKRDRLSAE